MSRTAQIVWWLEQVEAARRAVAEARTERWQPRRPGLLDEDVRARRARVAPLPKRPPAQEIIRGATITGERDEERARSIPAAGGGGGTGPGASPMRGAPTPISGGFSAGSNGAGMKSAGGGPLGRARQLAAGYQPAVIKVVSYARGIARATATGQYVQREDVPLETHDGRLLTDREAVADEISAWSTDFSKRAESQDVGAFRLTLAGVADNTEARATYEKAIAAAFSGHRYAARLDVDDNGALEAHVVAAMAGSGKERFRIREAQAADQEYDARPRRLDSVSDAAVRARIAAATGIDAETVVIRPGATSHGRDGVTYRLNKLIERGPATDDRGKSLSNVADARISAREWGPSLRSQSARDTMHMIISAKAGTDVAALSDAARAFLHDRFADHKFMFGVHTDKESSGHIHAHAVITVKNESGQKIHPNRDTFAEWREVYAKHAQAQGLKIVATSAKERASSQSYGPKDKAIVDAADRPRPARASRDRAYAADPANQRLIDNARQRIRTAKTNPIRVPMTAPDRKVVNESIVAWRVVAVEQPSNRMAKDMLERLLMAQTVGAILHTIGKRVEFLTRESEMPITSEQMVQDLRIMNDAVSRTSDLLDGETKQQFRETSGRYLETLANRIDLQRLQERGVQQLSPAEVEAVVGANADRLIEHAQEIRVKEEREATSAERLANRAIDVERRQEARGSIDPTSQEELKAERAIVVGSQQSAAREAREAAAAVEAAQAIAEHPAQPLPISLIQTDALAKLRAEQEKIVRELEAEKPSLQSIKGQRRS
ncbi:MAG: relaxase/mobilization nuclease domain-containing protein [Xanthobacteraceae bacterium]|nr:relaxase/mobilization nuclease domain-containing protein [Xanthobacteraceae bacterium]MBY0383452.1 relaxase/mobilization nuclease domain-containing protein [Xanthobacteraceae bacterium]